MLAARLSRPDTGPRSGRHDSCCVSARDRRIRATTPTAGRSDRALDLRRQEAIRAGQGRGGARPLSPRRRPTARRPLASAPDLRVRAQASAAGACHRLCAARGHGFSARGLSQARGGSAAQCVGARERWATGQLEGADRRGHRADPGAQTPGIVGGCRRHVRAHQRGLARTRLRRAGPAGPRVRAAAKSSHSSESSAKRPA